MTRIKSPDNHAVIGPSLHPLLVTAVLVGTFFFFCNELIISITAPGLKGEGYELATQLVQFSALSAGVVSIYYWFSGIRHLERNFLRVSVSELMPNIGMFIGILILYRLYGVIGIAFGITLGYLLQFSFVFDPKRINLSGFGPKTLLSADNRIIYKNTFFAALGMSGVIVDLFVDRYFASDLAEGSVASLNFAYKVMMLPLYTVVVAIVTVMFPKLIAMRDNIPAFLATKNKISLVIIGFSSINAVIFMYFSYQIIDLLFGYGLFDQSDVANTAPLLATYSAGLVFHALVMFHCKARYALEDFKIPLIGGTAGALVNVVLDFLLVDHYGAQGLAAATTAAGFTNACIVMFGPKPKGLGEVKTQAA